MFKAMRAMAAALGVSTAELRGKRYGDIARHAAGERRLRPVEAAPNLMNPSVRAEMASMWIGRTQALCRVSARYVEAAPHFGAILRLAPPPSEAMAPAGARALLQRLHAAGFVVAEEPAVTATALQQNAAVVRVLKEPPPRTRRTAWSDDGARRAA